MQKNEGSSSKSKPQRIKLDTRTVAELTEEHVLANRNIDKSWGSTSFCCPPHATWLDASQAIDDTE